MSYKGFVPLMYQNLWVFKLSILKKCVTICGHVENLFSEFLEMSQNKCEIGTGAFR